MRLFLKRNFLIAYVNFHLPACCMNIDEVTAQLQAPLVLRRRKHCMIDMVGLVAQKHFPGNAKLALFPRAFLKNVYR